MHLPLAYTLRLLLQVRFAQHCKPELEPMPPHFLLIPTQEPAGMHLPGAHLLVLLQVRFAQHCKPELDMAPPHVMLRAWQAVVVPVVLTVVAVAVVVVGVLVLAAVAEMLVTAVLTTVEVGCTVDSSTSS